MCFVSNGCNPEFFTEHAMSEVSWDRGGPAARSFNVGVSASLYFEAMRTGAKLSKQRSS